MERLQSFTDWLACREEVTGSAVAVGTTNGSPATTTSNTAGGNYPRPLFSKPHRRKSLGKVTFNFGKQKG